MAKKLVRKKRKFAPTGFIEVESELAEKLYWIGRVKHRTPSQILERCLRHGLKKLLRAAFAPPTSNP